MRKRLSFVLLSLMCVLLHAQVDMQPGFKLLETGDFQQATVFFKKVLEQEPDNLTAKLCYGRAIGLTDDPEAALEIFRQLIQKQPDNLEFKLNYAEALLWNKEYEKALNYYKVLTKKNPTNFVAHLGLANTYSNLKRYPDALETIGKALKLEPENPGAKISKKYIQLGYAYQLSKEKAYEKADSLLDDNLKMFPNDEETLENKSNLYLVWGKKDEILSLQQGFQKSTNPETQLKGIMGESLAWHLKEKDKKALKIAERIPEFLAQNTINENLKFSAMERLIQAYTWNKKLKIAEEKIAQLKKDYPSQTSRILALEAATAVYDQKFETAEKLNQDIIQLDSISFDGNLGLANSFFAQKKYRLAEDQAKKTLSIFPGQVDTENFLGKITRNFSPQIKNQTYYSFDKGDNEAIKTIFNLELPWSFKLRSIFFGNYRNTQNTITDLNAQQLNAGTGLAWLIAPKLELTTLVGLVDVQGELDYNEWLFSANLQYDLSPKLTLNGGFRQELQDFNVDLLNANIRMDHAYLNWNWNLPLNFGWYGQYYFTTQTDDNERNLFYTSLYNNINKVLKTGLSFQYITFKESRPAIYFSPEKFTAFEYFVQATQLDNPDKKKQLIYNVLIAVGLQNIEEEDTQSTFRADATLGYKFSPQFSMSVYGLYSNIASVTAAGFEYTELGIRLSYNFMNKLFK